MRHTGSGAPWDRTLKHSIALDSSGNGYVTGVKYNNDTFTDYLTLAYDSSGNELWVAEYNGPGNGGDEAHAITTDDSGNIYVTGSSCCSGTWNTFATVAYDSSGNELWVARYNGSGGGIGVIADSGRIYVTGAGDWDDATGWDYVTIAYDSSGNELWEARYDGPGSGIDEPYDLEVGPSGNIYVTGRSKDVGPSYSVDYATVAYDPSGNELWVARFSSPGWHHDRAFALDVDALSNVYVTGQMYGPGQDDYATVAYDSSGNELWVATYGSYRGDIAYDIAVTHSGIVYVTGLAYSNTEAKWDYTTIAYDSSGNELWLARYNGPGNDTDVAYAMAVDSSENLYVTGSSYGDVSQRDYATVAYDSLGNELWTARYDGPAQQSDNAWAIVVDNSGSVYVTGLSWNEGGGSDITTIRYSQKWAPEVLVDIRPDTLNLRSRGRWITAYIEMTEGTGIYDIDVSTILLNGTVPAENRPIAIGDYDKDGIPDLMVKFNRSAVQEYIEGLNISGEGPGRFGYEVILTLTGMYNDGTAFECSDTIRVLPGERMSVEPSPFLTSYQGMMRGGQEKVHPQMSFSSSSHCLEQVAKVVSKDYYRSAPLPLKMWRE